MKKVMLAFFLLAWSCLAWSATAGKVELLEGDVRVLDAVSNKERPLKLGDIINEGDTLITGSKGEVHLAMEDGGQLALRPDTHMQIFKYKAEGGKSDSSVFRLLKGAMRSVTGWIGKYNTRNYEIRTPTATIGVRGTDHETRVIPEGSSEGQAGTYDKVNIGATQMRTKLGTTQIRPNQAGFVPAAGQFRPKRLEGVPGFFRPLQHDKRFDGLHDRVRQRLHEIRGQRIKQMVELRRNVMLQKRQKMLEGRQLKMKNNKQIDAVPGSPHPRLQEHRKQREERGYFLPGRQDAVGPGPGGRWRGRK